MGIPYDGQLRFGGVHEWDPSESVYKGCFNPTASAAAPAIAASADTAVDWGNVLACVQASASEDRYLQYELGVRDHGDSQNTTGVYNKDRHTVRLGARVRIPTVAFGAGEVLPFLSLRSSAGTEYARVAVVNDAGTLRLRVRDFGGTSYTSATAVTAGAWLDLDFLYDRPAATLALYSSPAGADTWTTEVSQTAITGMQNVGVLRLGALGASKTSASGVHTVEVHSLRWQFHNARRAFYTNNSTKGRLTGTDEASLRIDGTEDVWFSAWVMVESTGGDHAILCKGDQGTSQEWQLLWSSSAQAYQFRMASASAPTTDQSVTANATTVIDIWEFVLGWYDASAGTINIRRNDGTTASAAFTGTPNTAANPLTLGFRTTGGVNGTWHNGRISCTGIGRLPAGTLTAQIASIQTTLYNGGVPVFGDFLDPAFIVSSGMTSYWDLDDNFSTYYDRIGDLALAKTGTVQMKQSAKPLFVPSQAASRAGATQFPASRISDVGPDAAIGVLFVRPGEWRGATHARIRYGLDSGLAGSSVGAWTAITGASVDNGYMLHLPALSGLSGNTRYYYRYELSRDGTTAHVQGEIRRFRTLPAIGSDDIVRLHNWSCTRFSDEGQPSRDVGDMLDSLDGAGLDLHRSMHQGDYYYEWFQDINGPGAYEPNHFVRLALSVSYDPNVVRLARQTTLCISPSDHEVCNGSDSRMRVDPTYRALEAIEVNLPGVQATYPTGTTLGGIYDAAEPVLLGWMFGPMLGTNPTTIPPSANGSDFNKAASALRWGRVWEIRLDHLYAGRNEDGSKAIGVEQDAWAKSEIDAFNADPDADLLLIDGSAPITRLYGKSGSWPITAGAEAEAFVEYAHLNVNAAAGKGIVLIGGDTHAGVWASRAFPGAAGAIRAAPWGDDNSAFPWKLEIGASPTSSISSLGSTTPPSDPTLEPYVGHFWNAAERYGIINGGALLKASGPLTTLKQAAGTLDVEYWTDFGVHYQPAEVQDYPVMLAATAPPEDTVILTDTFQNATAGTVSLSDHPGDTGHGWTLLTGTFGVVPADYAIVGSSSQARAVANVPLVGHDAIGEWEMEWITITKAFQCLFLLVDSGNYFDVQSTTAGVVRLRKWTAGSNAAVGADYTYGTPAIGQRVRFRLQVAGNVVSLYVSIHDGTSFPAYSATPVHTWTDADIGGATGRLWGIGSLGSSTGEGAGFRYFHAEDTAAAGAPTANFRHLADGLNAQFFDESSDSETSVAVRAWAFGDGGISASTDPSHTYAAPGVYAVTLDVEDTQGNPGTITKNVVAWARAADPFRDADATLLAGKALREGGTWSVPSGAFVVTGERASPSGAAGAAGHLAVVDLPGSANGVIRTIARVGALTANRFGVAFRYVDIDNFVALAIDTSAGTVCIAQRTAGVWSYGTPRALTGKTTDYVIDLALSPTSVVVTIDGVEIWASTNTSNPTATKHGLWSEGSGASFAMFDATTSRVYDLFGRAGQSNALGYGDSALSTDPLDGSAYQYDGGLAPLEDPVLGAGTGSAWPAFGIEYVARTGHLPVIAGHAVGGSAQSALAAGPNGHWDDGGAHYGTYVANLWSAIEGLQATGAGVHFRGTLWIQGGRDSQYIGVDLTVADYKAALLNMLSKLRVEFGAGYRHWMSRIGTDSTDVDSPGWAAVRAAQEEVALAASDVYIVSLLALGFPARGLYQDNFHYTQAGYNELGADMAVHVADEIELASVPGNTAPTIAIDQGASANLAAGGTLQLSATVSDAEDTPDPTPAWSTSNAAVATVSSTGLVTWVSAGSVTITATVTDAGGIPASDSIAITAGAAATTVTIAGASTRSLAAGGTIQLSASVTDGVGTTVWSSSNPAVATVSASGLVTWVSAGQTVITATNNGASDTVTVNAAALVTTVAIAGADPQSVEVGATLQLTATVTNGSGSTTWASSDPAVATVSSTGLVSGIAAGSATITATNNGVSDTIGITVAALAPPPPPVITSPLEGATVTGPFTLSWGPG